MGYAEGGLGSAGSGVAEAGYVSYPLPMSLAFYDSVAGLDVTFQVQERD